MSEPLIKSRTVLEAEIQELKVDVQRLQEKLDSALRVGEMRRQELELAKTAIYTTAFFLALGGEPEKMRANASRTLVSAIKVLFNE